MKTEIEWDKDILKITMEIHEKYPELIKFIEEIPVKHVDRDDKQVTLKNLEEYYASLVTMVKNYSKTHVSE